MELHKAFVDFFEGVVGYKQKGDFFKKPLQDGLKSRKVIVMK